MDTNKIELDLKRTQSVERKLVATITVVFYAVMVALIYMTG